MHVLHGLIRLFRDDVGWIQYKEAFVVDGPLLGLDKIVVQRSFF